MIEWLNQKLNEKKGGIADMNFGKPPVAASTLSSFKPSFASIDQVAGSGGIAERSPYRAQNNTHLIQTPQSVSSSSTGIRAMSPANMPK